MKPLPIIFALVLGMTNVAHSESLEAPLSGLIESFADLNGLDYSNSPGPALKDLQGWHQSTPKQTIRITWLMDPNVRTQTRSAIRLQDGMKYSHRYVYSWAIQGNFVKYLRKERLADIEKILDDMPQGIGSVKDTRDLVIISFHRDGKVRELAYQRTKLPPAVMRLCLVGDINIDISPAPESE